MFVEHGWGALLRSMFVEHGWGAWLRSMVEEHGCGACLRSIVDSFSLVLKSVNLRFQLVKFYVKNFFKSKYYEHLLTTLFTTHVN
jgi:hypothetical protein